jgi:signal transduction histidine kinase
LDTKWRNNLNVVGWLFLFTLGLSGLMPLLGGYFYSPVAAYVQMAAGAAAITASMLLLRKVDVAALFNYPSIRSLYHRIPIDLRVLAAFVFLLITIGNLCGNIVQIPFTAMSGIFLVKSLVMITVLVTLTIVQGWFLFEVWRDAAFRHSSWQNSLVYRTWTAIKESFLTQSVGFGLFWTLGVMFASGFGLMIVLYIHGAAVLYIPLFVLVTLPTLFGVVRRTGYFNRMVQTAAIVATGFPQPDLPLYGHSGLRQLAGSINQMKRGVESSHAAQARSERLKTDLITNVSHDLRTPLTAIITYIDLLKMPDVSEENRTLYVDVLAEKSQRLKALIEDLFEASKMASGNTELVKQQVDISQLLEQALAERDEDISASTLEFRVTKPDTPVNCLVDGQKMWRVFDNLIGNILKYSLDGTRVYISMISTPDALTLTFRNIAKYELNGDVDELFERFRRGDESRHTEGSGLGLAIAKSIVDLHGGTLELMTDGDLFKATIMLPI